MLIVYIKNFSLNVLFDIYQVIQDCAHTMVLSWGPMVSFVLQLILSVLEM